MCVWVHVLSIGACILGAGFFGFSVGLDAAARSLRSDADRNGPTSISSSDVRGVSGGPGPLDLAPLRVPLVPAASADGGAGGGARMGASVGPTVSISSVPSGVPRACGEDTVRAAELPAAIALATFVGVATLGDS